MTASPGKYILLLYGPNVTENPHMQSLLTPQRFATHRLTAPGILLLLVLSAVTELVAPGAMSPSYSWSANFISEAAAQGIAGAWVARLGFLMFGFAVLWLSVAIRPLWPRGTYWSQMAFGVFMVSTAAFSHRPWAANAPFDPFEDILHSVTATAMGFAFAFGVLVRLVQRGRDGESGRGFDAVALVATIVLPLVGWIWPSIPGLMQRLMFLVAYLWYGRETLLVRGIGRGTKKDVPNAIPTGD